MSRALRHSLVVPASFSADREQRQTPPHLRQEAILPSTALVARSPFSAGIPLMNDHPAAGEVSSDDQSVRCGSPGMAVIYLPGATGWPASSVRRAAYRRDLSHPWESSPSNHHQAISSRPGAWRWSERTTRGFVPILGSSRVNTALAIPCPTLRTMAGLRFTSLIAARRLVLPKQRKSSVLAIRGRSHLEVGTRRHCC